MMKTIVSLFAAALLVPSLAAQPAAKLKTKPKKETVTSEDIKALRDALAAQSAMLATQQQQIQELKQELERRDQTSQEAQRQLEQTRAAATDAQTKTAALEAAANDQTAAVAKLSTDVADVKADVTKNSGSEKEDRKRLSVLEGTLGRFRFSGDIRVRDDSIFQSCASCFDRNRARLRVRFGLEGTKRRLHGRLLPGHGIVG